METIPGIKWRSKASLRVGVLAGPLDSTSRPCFWVDQLAANDVENKRNEISFILKIRCDDISRDLIYLRPGSLVLWYHHYLWDYTSRRYILWVWQAHNVSIGRSRVPVKSTALFLSAGEFSFIEWWVMRKVEAIILQELLMSSYFSVIFKYFYDNYHLMTFNVSIL